MSDHAIEPPRHGPPRNRKALTPTRNPLTDTLLAIAIRAVLAPAAMAAQASAADAGAMLWAAFRSVLYGPWGLVGSAVVVAMGIYMFLERGFMHALGVMAAGALLFFVPLIVISMRGLLHPRLRTRVS